MSVVGEVKEFYSNDIVYRFDKRKRITFGVVVDSYEASTDSDFCNPLQKGQIRVWWLNNSRAQVWRQNKVHLMSRSVIPGDIVRRLVNGKETQRGYCKESKQFATVQIIGTDKIIERVSSDRLNTVLPYDVNVAVCLGDKYGRIENIDQKIVMHSKCGSVVEILSSINDIEDYWLTKRNRCFIATFYPGQEVICTPNNLEQPNWLNRTKTMKRNMHTRQRFTIQSVEPTDIEVVWIDSSPKGFAGTSDLKPEEIKKLKILEPSDNKYFLELVERRLLKLCASDVLIKKRDWIHKQSALHRPDAYKIRHLVNRTPRNNFRVPKLTTTSLLTTCVEAGEPEDDWWTEEGEVSDNGSSSSSTSGSCFRKKHYPPKPRELVPGHTLAVEVLCVDSKATVVWQDGTEERDIPTTQLYYSMSLDDHEFFPGEWVVKAEKDDPNVYGAVQSVNYLERTAAVKWFEGSENQQQPPKVLMIDEMSVYDLKKHPKYAFRPGGVVKSKPTVENKLGRILDTSPEGYVMVQWIDGVEENCSPQNLELIPDNIDFEYTDTENGDEDGQISWETESIESIAGDITDETTLQNMAARLDFIRGRIVYLKDAFRLHSITENFAFLRDLLMVYDNSSYLDKLLDTSFFSLKSKHFQALLVQVREKAKTYGVELRGRLFSSDNLFPSSTTKFKSAEKENINKVLKMENKINAQIESNKVAARENGEPVTPLTPDSTITDSSATSAISHENLCVELLSMLKVRMDLAYAEIISRIGGAQALTVMTKASEKISGSPMSSTPLPSVPVTPEDSFCLLNPPKFPAVAQAPEVAAEVGESEAYSVADEAHSTHRFFANKFEPTDRQRFYKAVQKEHKLLRESLPPGVWVRSYSDRLDLLSVMIRGPNKTPYEDGLFFFDVQLSQDYPRSPPLCHYISYSSERLNPNLYVEGKVCVSLLGTWMGRGTEVWGPNSTLLQLIVSIQGLILVSEPYYNEAGYEKQSESQQGGENSRTYNELVILKLVQSMTEMLLSPPAAFRQEVYRHFAKSGPGMIARLQLFCGDAEPLKPDFPLLPVSKGLKLSLNGALNSFGNVLRNVLKENGLSCEDIQ